MALRFLCVMAVLLSALFAVGKTPPDTMTGVFDERVKSLQVRLDGDNFAAPVVVLGTPDRIVINFDILAEDRDYLRYSLTHCNAFWQPSGLVDSEFLDGFNEGTIDDYRFSRGTTVHYVNYTLSIPNEQVRPTISGNYLLKVYNEDDPDAILLQCRFMISEETAPIALSASAQTDIDYNKSHQQLSIIVDSERAHVEDPFNDHRRLEAVSDSYPGMAVERIEYFAPYYHYVLYPDAPRSADEYAYDQTQHGRYFIRNYASDDSDIEADYGVVHFTLDMPEQPGAMIFIDGDFVQRRFDDNSRMFYNHATRRYERAMLLKQGAYNYQYLFVPPGASRGYTAQIEGDRYQTVNEYSVRVYHRRRGERYDRLIGTANCRNDI